MTHYLSVSEALCVRNNRILFEQLSFTLNPGEILHLKGENGIGKTTFLRCLAGFSKLYAGEIKFIDFPPTATSDYRAQLLYLGHKQALKPNLTATENLRYSLLFENPDEEKIDFCLHKAGLFAKKNNLAANLSSGQRQRLSLAKLLLARRPLWLLDEPFTALDHAGITWGQALMQDHLIDGGMIIFTSHQGLPLEMNGLFSIELTPLLHVVEWQEI